MNNEKPLETEPVETDSTEKTRYETAKEKVGDFNQEWVKPAAKDAAEAAQTGFNAAKETAGNAYRKGKPYAEAARQKAGQAAGATYRTVKSGVEKGKSGGKKVLFYLFFITLSVIVLGIVGVLALWNGWQGLLTFWSLVLTLGPVFLVFRYLRKRWYPTDKELEQDYEVEEFEEFDEFEDNEEDKN